MLTCWSPPTKYSVSAVLKQTLTTNSSSKDFKSSNESTRIRHSILPSNLTYSNLSRDPFIKLQSFLGHFSNSLLFIPYPLLHISQGSNAAATPSCCLGIKAQRPLLPLTQLGCVELGQGTKHFADTTAILVITLCVCFPDFSLYL